MVDDDYPVSFEQRNLAIMRWLWHVSSMVLSRGLGSSNNNANNIAITFISLIKNFDNANQWVVSTKQAQNKHWSEWGSFEESWCTLEYKAPLISIGAVSCSLAHNVTLQSFVVSCGPLRYLVIPVCSVAFFHMSLACSLVCWALWRPIECTKMAEPIEMPFRHGIRLSQFCGLHWAHDKTFLFTYAIRNPNKHL